MDALESLVDRLPPATVSTHHGELATHARDRWALAMLRDVRGDRVPPPAALVFPLSTDHVQEVLAWAQDTRSAVVVRGGGTGVSGGAGALKRSVVLDLSRMNRVLEVDTVSQTVAAEAGARAGGVDALLARDGLTLGQHPESPHFATVGGLVATNATGHPAAGFGGVDALVLGLTVVLPGGRRVRLGGPPGSGVGRLLRGLFLGSEGTLGVVTEATLAASRMPGELAWEVFGPRSFDAAVGLAREVAQRPFRVLVSRLLDPAEAEAAYAPWGHDRGPILMLGFDARAPGAQTERIAARRLAKELGARALAAELAEHWWDHRHDGIEWYESVMGPERALGRGVVADFLDVPALWRRVPRVYEEVRSALFRHAESVGCRILNPSASGASVFFTFVLRGEDDRTVEETYARAWEDAARAAVEAGGGLSSALGIGALKAPFVSLELGGEGTALLRDLKRVMDPAGIMNPGKLVPEEAAPEDRRR